jgi:hypothetical protein
MCQFFNFFFWQSHVTSSSSSQYIGRNVKQSEVRVEGRRPYPSPHNTYISSEHVSARSQREVLQECAHKVFRVSVDMLRTRSQLESSSWGLSLKLVEAF